MKHPPADCSRKRCAENAPATEQTRVQREYPPKAKADWALCQVEMPEVTDADT
jgi:hypothetical protein